MGVITIVNNSAYDIHAKVAKDAEKGGSDRWYTLGARGGRDTWSREENQVIYVVRSLGPGALVETLLGVPGATVTIP